MEHIYKEIIKKIRKNNIKQEELSKKLKINQSALSKNLKSIKNGTCSLEVLNRLCKKLDLELQIQPRKKALQVDPEELLK